MEEDFIVTINDIRKTGHCVRGIRGWFDLHMLDFPGFLKNGIPASMLLATDDELAKDVVGKIKERMTNG